MDPLCGARGSCVQAAVRTLNHASLLQLCLHHGGQMFFQIPREEDKFYRESLFRGWLGDTKKKKKKKTQEKSLKIGKDLDFLKGKNNMESGIPRWGMSDSQSS